MNFAEFKTGFPWKLYQFFNSALWRSQLWGKSVTWINQRPRTLLLQGLQLRQMPSVMTALETEKKIWGPELVLRVVFLLSECIHKQWFAALIQVSTRWIFPRFGEVLFICQHLLILSSLSFLFFFFFFNDLKCCICFIHWQAAFKFLIE